MKGDFSRNSFDPLRRFSRVLQQQGRLELDADANERQAIQLHLLRTLAADLIGPAGGPGDGFAIDVTVAGVKLHQNFSIAPGHYYVNGWLCENDALGPYDPDGAWPVPAPIPAPVPVPMPMPMVSAAKTAGVPRLQPGLRYLVYIDVWERHVAAAEADGPLQRRSATALREVALGGPDTASRAQVVWRVRAASVAALPLPPEPVSAADWRQWMATAWPDWVAQWQPPQRGRLKAKAADPAAAQARNACAVAPDARYRGPENQLYRIEIHRGGQVGQKTPPTFVWSRDNGSVLYAIANIAGPSVTLAEGWRDARNALNVGDCVELTDDGVALDGAVGALHTIIAIDTDALVVTLDRAPDITTDLPDSHPVLRRWDHGGRKPGNDGSAAAANDGALEVAEGRWLAIEDGLVVWFEPGDAKTPQRYRAGDHWLLPARVALGDVLWPTDPSGAPLPQPPHGVQHHYAPLAAIQVAADGTVTLAAGESPRRRFKQLVDL